MMAGLSRPLAIGAIPARAAAVLAAAAIVGAGLLVAQAAMSRRPGPARTVLLPAARDGYGYLLLALATRFTVRQHRSRLQIGLLLVVVAVVEAARRRPQGRGAARGTTWLAGSAAVCLGVLLAKWALEPGALSDTLSRLRPEAPD
jgi:hypothetical protein